MHRFITPLQNNSATVKPHNYVSLHNSAIVKTPLMASLQILSEPLITQIKMINYDFIRRGVINHTLQLAKISVICVICDSDNIIILIEIKILYLQ